MKHVYNIAAEGLTGVSAVCTAHSPAGLWPALSHWLQSQLIVSQWMPAWSMWTGNSYISSHCPLSPAKKHRTFRLRTNSTAEVLGSVIKCTVCCNSTCRHSALSWSLGLSTTHFAHCYWGNCGPSCLADGPGGHSWCWSPNCTLGRHHNKLFWLSKHTFQVITEECGFCNKVNQMDQISGS